MKPLLFVILQAWLFLSSESMKRGDNGERTVCSSNVCKDRVKLINESLDYCASPCDDFYSFACGGWESKQKERNPDVEHFSVYDTLKREVKRTLKDILEGLNRSRTNQNIKDKIGVIYSACLESSVAFPNVSDNPDGMKKVLASAGLSEWPILTNTTPNVPEAHNRTAMLLKIGTRALFEIIVQKDPENSMCHILQIRKPGGTRSEVNDTREALKEAALFLRPNASEPELDKFSESVVRYGLKLKGFGATRTRKNQRLKIDDLEKKFSNIPVLYLLNKEFENLNITLTTNDTVELRPLGFYEELDAFFASLDPITMYNYVGSQVMFAVGAQASKPFRSSFLRVRGYYQGYSPGERWEECSELTESNMPEAVNYLYAEYMQNSSVKAEVEDIVTRIKDALQEKFLNSSWIDETSRNSLVEKLKNMSVIVGHEEALLNLKPLEELYKDVLQIGSNSTFVELFYNISKSHYERGLKKLGEKYRVEEAFRVSASAVKASYSRVENKLVIPWGLLQPPVYQHGLPLSLLYGAIGTVVAEEMARAVGTEGILLDADGNHKNLLSNVTRPKFDEKTKCFVNQYRNVQINISKEYGAPHIDGKRTLEENLMDNVGLQSAYSAYRKLLDEDCGGMDMRLQGFKNFTGKQLFFLARAMGSCTFLSEYELFFYIWRHRDSPPMSSVNVPLKNLEAFAEAFNCEENSAMAARKNEICQLW